MTFRPIFDSFRIFGLFLLSSVISAPAFAASIPECFEFPDINLQGAEPLAFLQNDSALFHRWCYQKINNAPDSPLLIFGADSQTLKPELSALVQVDEMGNAKSMSTGSLSLGQVQFLSTDDLSLNPFAIPLSLQEARSLGKSVSIKNPPAPQDLQALSLRHQLEAVPGKPLVVTAGNFSASVTQKKMPFNGFWWSNEGVPMATGGNSPLGSYDAYVTARSGKNPNTVGWENLNHSDTTTAWGGHCNGWAASSVLYPEPTHTLYDSLTHTMITPYAQKGMLAEAAFCLNDAFYGTRYNGPKGDLLDIYPDLFHKVLIYYLGTLGKPVAMDYERGIEIDNNVITGYQFQIVKIASTDSTQTFHVNAALTVAQYDIEQRDSLGAVSTYQKNYSYTLITDGKGMIQSGKWDLASDNPDFLWVPLSMSENCSPRNPNLNLETVDQILTELPAAVPKQINLEFAAKTSLIPQGQIPVPLKIEAGDQMILALSVSALTPKPKNDLFLIVSGNSRYPVTGGEKESMFIPIQLGNENIALDQLLSIDTIAFVNQSTKTSYQLKLGIKHFSYLGPN
jgi:hypothetical protein